MKHFHLGCARARRPMNWAQCDALENDIWSRFGAAGLLVIIIEKLQVAGSATMRRPTGVCRRSLGQVAAGQKVNCLRLCSHTHKIMRPPSVSRAEMRLIPAGRERLACLACLACRDRRPGWPGRPAGSPKRATPPLPPPSALKRPIASGPLALAGNKFRLMAARGGGGAVGSS